MEHVESLPCQSDGRHQFCYKPTFPFDGLLPDRTAVRRLEVEESMGWESMDILEFPELRTAMKVYSNWPTFPQVYIDGEFYGGCDILTEAFESGELAEYLEVLRNQ